MSNVIDKNNDFEMKILAIKLLPIMTEKLETSVQEVEDATTYPHYKLLLKQIQFIYQALGVKDESSDFVSGKLVINHSLKVILTNYLLDSLNILNVEENKIRIIKQRIEQIKITES